MRPKTPNRPDTNEKVGELFVRVVPGDGEHVEESAYQFGVTQFATHEEGLCGASP